MSPVVYVILGAVLGGVVVGLLLCWVIRFCTEQIIGRMFGW